MFTGTPKNNRLQVLSLNESWCTELYAIRPNLNFKATPNIDLDGDICVLGVWYEWGLNVRHSCRTYSTETNKKDSINQTENTRKPIPKLQLHLFVVT